jgi:hypothetical protein
MHENFMGGIDNIDKEEEVWVSFTKKAMLKQWY